MLLRLAEVLAVALSLEQRQQRRQRCPDITDDAEIDGHAATDVLRSQIDLRDADAVSFRIELAIGEVGPEHQQDVAISHCKVSGREADEPSHADVVGVLLSTCSLPRIACTIGALRRSPTAMSSSWAPWHPEPHRMVTRMSSPLSSAARRSRSACRGVTTGACGSSPSALGLGPSIAGCKATSPGMTTTDTPRLPTASRIATSSTRGI